MHSITLLASPLPLERVLEFTRVEVYSLDKLAKELLFAIEGGNPIPFMEFEALTSESVISRFDFYREEVELSGMLILLATIESILRLDYTSKRKKNRNFRTLYATYRSKVRLKDLIDAWVNERPNDRQIFESYKGALRLRNWLAHGRYFFQNLGRKNYSVDYIYQLGIQIRTILES